MKAHLVGGGLASLAAAASLIRDGGLLGSNITVYEAQEGLGGGMGMSGGPESGYVLPTGRVFESEYRCALELFSQVPSASDPHRSIRDEIVEFSERYGYFDVTHVMDRQGQAVSSPHYGLSRQDRLDLLKLALTPESRLDLRRIDEFFSPEFFETEFWFLWAPLMGCLPQHSAIEMRRFLYRFLHLLPDLSTMTQIYRTRFNQYEAITKPVVDWLGRQGVRFLTNALVTDVEFTPERDRLTANALHYRKECRTTVVDVAPEDIVLVTNGSQVADFSIGSMTAPAPLRLIGDSWRLWQRLAHARPGLGSPEIFFGKSHLQDTAWLTFTVTTSDPLFFELTTELTGSEPGRGGLMTFKDSGWIITLALFHQPEFVGQPDDVMVWWGYGIRPYEEGDFVKKPMVEATGAEILEETVRHLKFDRHVERIVDGSTCIPSLLPYAGSVWMTRGHEDRPDVVPDGATNFGFIGQFAEVAHETVFTMEYSVRTAREAVATLLKLEDRPPPVYQGHHDPQALYQALRSLAWNGAEPRVANRPRG